jgi:hypothetical protein
MAHTATLIIGNNLDANKILRKDFDKNNSYNLLRCNYNFVKPIQKSGRPCGHASGGQIRILLETLGNDNTFFSDWVLTTIEHKDGAIAFELPHNKRENLYFKRAYCVHFAEEFDEYSEEQMLTEIVLSAEKISFDSGLPYYNVIWDDDDDNTSQSIVSKITEDEITLVREVSGKDKATPGQKLTFRVTEYNKPISDIFQRERDRIRWAIDIDGEQEELSDTGEKISLEIKEEWAGKEIIVMACLGNEFDEEVGQRTKVRLNDKGDHVFDGQGNFIKRMGNETDYVLIQSANGSKRNITTFNFSPMQAKNREMLSNVMSYFARKVGIIQEIRVLDINNPEHSGAFASTNRHSRLVSISVVNEQLNSTAETAHNIINAFVHESVHKQGDDCELNAILAQTAHSSWKKTTKSFKNGITSYAELEANKFLNLPENRDKEEPPQLEAINNNIDPNFILVVNRVAEAIYGLPGVDVVAPRINK